MQTKLFQHQRHNLILERLQNGEELSISKLAKEWDTTAKTLQRDFEKLQEGNYGIVRAEDGKRFKLSHRKQISKDALTTIQMLDSISSDIGGEFYAKSHKLLQQLEKYIISPFYTRIDVEDISNKMEMIQELENAISANKMVNFKYKRWYSPDDIKTYKNVKPYKIIIFNGFWYLLAESDKLVIKYYLKEISDLKIIEHTFVPNKQILDRMNKALDIWFDPKAEPFDVKLFLENDAIVYFERKPIRDQYLKKNRDGTAELSTTATHKEEIFSLLKKWLPQIRVIEPYGLQEEFEKLLKNYLIENI